eukprot:scaffold4837_cov218-Skeletonema_marinoi.AAC.2
MDDSVLSWRVSWLETKPARHLFQMLSPHVANNILRTRKLCNREYQKTKDDDIYQRPSSKQSTLDPPGRFLKKRADTGQWREQQRGRHQPTHLILLSPNDHLTSSIVL